MTLGVTVPATAKAEVASLALTSLRGAQPADESQPTSSPAPEGAQPTTAPATIASPEAMLK